MYKFTDKHVGNDYNIGTGISVTMEQLAKLIITKTGCNKEVSINNLATRKDGAEVTHLQCDFGLAKKEFEWAPTYTLDTGLDKAIKWYKTFSPNSVGYII